MNDEPELTSEQVVYYRRVLVAHGLSDGLCRICHVLRCPDWVDAFDTLAAAHQLMAPISTEQAATGARVGQRSI